jgi:hypothetical protein
VYADQLSQWRSVFPEQQLHVLSTSDLKRDPAGALGRALQFLDLPAGDVQLDTPQRNTGSYPPMPDATRERLRAFFRPHDERLVQLLGADPGWVGSR